LIRNGSRGHRADWSPRLIPTDAPWERRHVARLVVWMGVGLVGLGLSWFQISGEGDWHDQIRWIVVAVVALAVSGLGTAGWLMAASRAVHLEAHDVMSQLRLQQLNAGGSDVDSRVEPGSAAAVGYVSGPAMTKVHVSTCALVSGKSVSPVAGHEIEARGLQLCGVCRG
jgi:hypothetical protein